MQTLVTFPRLEVARKPTARDQKQEHLQTHPTDVHIGLATIAEMTSRFADEILEAGADGIFFTSHMSQASLLTEEACQTYVIPYDLIALERVKSQPAPLILHLHGEDLFFESANQYPAHAISWDTSKTSPSIAEALQLTDKTLLTGLDAKMLAQGTPSDARTQAQIALEQTGKQRLILGPGCAVEPKTPTENLQAIIDSDRSIE
ncbi:MAG: uroporphyrinogen decarboxylase family protein [Chloroflexota bacterium]